MSDSDPGFKEYCKALMANYKNWIDEKYPEQDVSQEHPMVYIESEKIGILYVNGNYLIQSPKNGPNSMD